MQTSQVSVEAGVSGKSGLDFVAVGLVSEGLTGFFAPRAQADIMIKELGQAGIRASYNEEYGCYAAPTGAIPDVNHPAVQRYGVDSKSHALWKEDRESQLNLEAILFGAADAISREPEMAKVREAAAPVSAKVASTPPRRQQGQVSDEQVAYSARAEAATQQGLKLVAAYIRGGLMLAGDRNPERRDQQLNMIREASREEITEVLDRTVKRFQELDNKEKFARFDHAIQNHLPEVEKLARAIDHDKAFQDRITWAVENLQSGKNTEAKFVLRGAFMRFEFDDQKRLGGGVTLDQQDKIPMDSLRRGFNALEKIHVERFGMPSGYRLTIGRSEGGVYKAALQSQGRPAPAAEGKPAAEPPAAQPAQLSRLQMRRRMMEQNSQGM
ncbi:hypothetical protein [Microvirga sp. VF16]|uniref:hypothetical protein n=1 Tax=Microvirga sp. VF16 TaxID=2807101 RepID=UPI00193E9E67|nr:hypothetical protein [Microvirga sp. VF16]QRM34979.1 hypothetical protein JO965_42730 [Microvirga sp. VF16]